MRWRKAENGANNGNNVYGFFQRIVINSTQYKRIILGRVEKMTESHYRIFCGEIWGRGWFYWGEM